MTFAAWVEIAKDVNASPGSPSEIFVIRECPKITIISPALDPKYEYQIHSNDELQRLGFSMSESAARQLCTLYVPHIEANDNVLLGAKRNGRRCATWSDVWLFYAQTPCPWEIMFPDYLVGFEPPNIREHAAYTGRKTVRRPVEDTRMPPEYAIPSLEAELKRRIEIDTADEGVDCGAATLWPAGRLGSIQGDSCG